MDQLVAFSPDWFSALGSIIIIDLLLAGDNALVIALAARNLPSHLQFKAVVFGTAGAVVVRIVGAVFAVFLLRVPFFGIIGGLLLLWIAHTLVAQQDSKHEGIEPAGSLFGAIRTIVIADAVMGLDNVVAIAAAARGEPVLVALGVIISIPIVMWGSIFVIKLLKRWPFIIWAGSGLLGYIAVSLMLSDPKLAGWAEGQTPVILMLIAVFAAVFFFAEGWLLARRRTASADSTAAAPQQDQNI